MDFLKELVAEHQKHLLQEAKTAAKFNVAPSDGPSWRVKVGNFLISSGLKLKGQRFKVPKQPTYTVS